MLAVLSLCLHDASAPAWTAARSLLCKDREAKKKKMPAVPYFTQQPAHMQQPSSLISGDSTELMRNEIEPDNGGLMRARGSRQHVLQLGGGAALLGPRIRGGGVQRVRQHALVDARQAPQPQEVCTTVDL